MKRKFFATLALFILVIVGALSPVFSFLGQRFEPQTVYAEATTSNPTTTETTSPDKLECGFNVLCAIVTGYVAFVQFLPHLFAEISGMLLDWVVWKNLQSDTWTSQDSVDSFVVKGWKLVRDFSNLFFIFALFAVAFSLILNGIGADERPLFGLDPKRTIAQVILMALLINFSFFMCRVIIDVANLTGNIFYNKITVIGNKGDNTQQTSTTNSKINMGDTATFYSNFATIRSVSLGILAKINPQELILQGGDVKGTKQEAALGLVSWYEYDMGVYVLLLFVSTITGIFNIFLIYLFLSTSIFLLSRIYGLFFLIILSPIAFISTAIPGLQSKEYFGFDDWFKQLTGLAFCLPIYLFFMYLAIFFLGIGEKIDNKSGYIALGTVITIKLVSMGAVLIFGKKIAKDLSGKFGAMATNAVTGVITGAAMIAGAAMTGGASAALSMSGRVAQRGAASVARGVGGAIVGDEKAQEWEQKLRSMNGGGLKRLNNFNPMRDMEGKTLNQKAGQFFKNFGAATGEMARMAGSKAPDQITNGFNVGGRYGSRVDLKNQIKQVDAELIAANKKFYDPNTSAAEKEQLRTEIMVLEAKKKAIQNGTYVQGTPPPNAGTSGNNSASAGNNQAPNSGAQNTNPSGGNPGNGGGGNTSGNNNGGGGNNGGPRPNNGGAGTNTGGPTGGGRGAGGTGGNFNGANGNSTGANNNSQSGNAGAGNAASNASTAPSPHDLLGVDKDATWDEIKKAYRKKTLENHPDRGGDEETFRKIKDAYEQLAKDPRYANKTKGASGPGPTSTSSTNTTSNPGPTSGGSNGSQKPVAKTMNLLSGINSYNANTFAPRNNQQPVGQLSLRQDAVVPKPQGVAGALALGMGSSVAAPAAIALNPTTGTTSGGISLSQGGTATPLAPVKRQLGDGLGPKPTFTPVQQQRFENKAAAAVSRGAAVQAGIERKQEAQQSAQTITQKISATEIPLSTISPVLGATPLGNKTVSVGKVVDTVAKLDNPITQYIPEVGPELKLAGKVATVAKNIGVTAPPKPATIPVPPSVQQPITSSNPIAFNQLSNQQDKLIAKNIQNELDSNDLKV